MFVNFISCLDFLSPLESIRFNTNTRFKSFFGGITSLIVIAFSFAMTFYISLDLFLKNEPKTIQSIEILDKLEDYYFSKKQIEFFFTLKFNNSTAYIDESIYTVRAYQTETFNKITEKGIEIMTYEYPINIHPCSHFYSQNEISNTNVNFPIDKYYCLPPDKFKLKGFAGSKIFDSIKIYIDKCTDTDHIKTNQTNLNSTSIINSNSTLNESEKNNVNKKNNSTKKCKPFEDINSYLSQGFINILTSDILINEKNYEFPFTKYFKDISDVISDENCSFNHIIYFNILNIQSDQGLIFEDLKENNTLKIYDTRTSYNFKANENIAFIQLEISNYKNKYKRTYPKIQDILTKVGGFINSINIIGYLLYYFYYRAFKIIDLITENHLHAFNYTLKKTNLMEFSEFVVSYNYNRLMSDMERSNILENKEKSKLDFLKSESDISKKKNTIEKRNFINTEIQKKLNFDNILSSKVIDVKKIKNEDHINNKTEVVTRRKYPEMKEVDKPKKKLKSDNNVRNLKILNQLEGYSINNRLNIFDEDGIQENKKEESQTTHKKIQFQEDKIDSIEEIKAIDDDFAVNKISFKKSINFKTEKLDILYPNNHFNENYKHKNYYLEESINNEYKISENNRLNSEASSYLNSSNKSNVCLMNKNYPKKKKLNLALDSNINKNLNTFGTHHIKKINNTTQNKNVLNIPDDNIKENEFDAIQELKPEKIDAKINNNFLEINIYQPYRSSFKENNNNYFHLNKHLNKNNDLKNTNYIINRKLKLEEDEPNIDSPIKTLKECPLGANNKKKQEKETKLLGKNDIKLKSPQKPKSHLVKYEIKKSLNFNSQKFNFKMKNNLFCTYWCNNKNKKLQIILKNKERLLDNFLSMENLAKISFDVKILKFLYLDIEKINLIDKLYEYLIIDNESIIKFRSLILKDRFDSVHDVKLENQSSDNLEDDIFNKDYNEKLNFIKDLLKLD